jgi:hypothetical protein
MAENNDLYKAYSILGSATTAEYNRRRKEEEKERKRARKDKYISYLAAPLLKGAGEALAGGIGSVVGDLVLGDNAKNYFNTEQGIIATRNAKYIDKQEKKLIQQREQLTTGGKSELEGQTDFITGRVRAELEAKFGSDNKVIVDQMLRESSEAINLEAVNLVEKRNKLITETSLQPDVSDYKTRLKEDDSFYGQNIGTKIARSIVGRFTGRSPAESGALYMLTGSTDPTELQRERAGNMMSPEYISGLSKELEKLSSASSGVAENAMSIWASKNPEAWNSITESQQQAVIERVKDVDYSANVSTELKSQRAQDDPAYSEFVASNNTKYSNINTLREAYARKVGGVTSEQSRDFTAMVLANESFQPSAVRLEQAVARHVFGVASNVVSDSEKLQGIKDYDKIQKATKDFIGDVLMPSFNRDLGIAIGQMSPDQQALIGQPGVKFQMAQEYAAFQINNNLKTGNLLQDVDMFDPNDYAEQEMSVLKNPKAGISFLLNASNTEEKTDRLRNAAIDSGSASMQDQASRQLVQPFYKAVDTSETREMFSFVSNPAVPRSQREERLNAGMAILAEQIKARAISQGYKTVDGSANISPSLLEEIEKLQRSLYEQIYPSTTTGTGL